jgi:RNA-directed DNA polymerase
MITERTEGAPLDPSVSATTNEAGAWHAINWCHAERTVRRLQARITQATQQGKWGKVKALQRLLTHSFSGKALAVRRVTENTGKRTPGVDGQTWKTPEQKAEAIQSLQQRGYHPQPLRRVSIVRFVPLKGLMKPGKGVRSITDLNNFISKEVRKYHLLPLPLR